jgi:hypothetical protein
MINAEFMVSVKMLMQLFNVNVLFSMMEFIVMNVCIDKLVFFVEKKILLLICR